MSSQHEKMFDLTRNEGYTNEFHSEIIFCTIS